MKFALTQFILLLSNVRKEGNVFLMTHSTHFIYGYMASDMVKDHSDSERKPAAATWAISSCGALAGTISEYNGYITICIYHFLCTCRVLRSGSCFRKISTLYCPLY